ncbi:MAG TPA: DUF1552 domain-containing protein [Verrucomicrobiae bacterium]
MNKSWQIPRRTFLKGLGTMLALPSLEAMVSPVANAAEAVAGAAAGALPRRMAFVYIPNGVIGENWFPQGTGANYLLSPTLAPLKNVKDDVLIVSGLKHDKAKANGDGAGDHARANATFLTGVQARKTAGADIRVGTSVDQIAAMKIGRQTRFPSLELSCDKARQAGSCDSGYSCAYQYNLSWKTETMPMAPENDPRRVFERLFGGGSANENAQAQALRKQYDKSILDFVMEDAKRLQAQLGTNDKRKVDEYLAGVRELELQIEASEKFNAKELDYKKPTGIPKEKSNHFKLMYDLMTLAFKTDTTRISTFLMAHDGSNSPFPEIGIPDGHHNLSHHQNDKTMIEKLKRIDHFHMQNFAYFIQKLKDTKEADGTPLLDNCMVVLGSGIGDGNRHTHHDLPVVIAGKGGGTIKTGRHLKLPEQVPMTNLYLSMLDRMGVTGIPRLGDSTGRFQYLG